MNNPAIPMMGNTVAAGFPSPASDYIEKELSLHDIVIANPPATYFLRVRGDSMIAASIPSGAILVVDRSIEARSGHIIIGWLDGQWCVKRMEKTYDGCILRSENPRYAPITITPETNFQVWGVVTFAIVDTQNNAT